MTPLDSVVSCVSGYDPDALPVGLARSIIGRLATPVRGTDTVPLREALARVLALEVIAPIDVPAYDNSAMDGFAFASSALAGGDELTLPVIGTALAGRPFTASVPPNACVRVMTGAMMPPGCDAVVPQELVHRTQGCDGALPQARFATAGLRAGANRRLAGEDIKRGGVVLKAGRIIRSSDLGLLASLGIGEATVRRKLRVAYFSTGDELRSIGQPLDPGCVYDSNRYTIDSMLRRLNVDPIDLGVVRDDAHSIEAALRDGAARADAIVTSGGVSVGDADFVRPLMSSLGEVVFWKMAMRPGRPMAFGRLRRGSPHVGGLHNAPGPATDDDSVLLFGLPGNPVAVMVGFYELVRGALLTMMGADAPPLPRVTARLTSPISKRAGRTEYLRGVAERLEDGSWSVAIAGSQSSGVLRSMSTANCLIELEHERPAVTAGDMVDIVFFEGLI